MRQSKQKFYLRTISLRLVCFKINPDYINIKINKFLLIGLETRINHKKRSSFTYIYFDDKEKSEKKPINQLR